MPKKTLNTQLGIENRAAILKFIINFKIQHGGVAPTIREIGQALGYAPSTTAAIANHLKILEHSGTITIHHTYRGIAVTGYEYRPIQEGDNHDVP